MMVDKVHTAIGQTSGIKNRAVFPIGERKKTPVTTHRRFLCEGIHSFIPCALFDRQNIRESHGFHDLHHEITDMDHLHGAALFDHFLMGQEQHAQSGGGNIDQFSKSMISSVTPLSRFLISRSRSGAVVMSIRPSRAIVRIPLC